MGLSSRGFQMIKVWSSDVTPEFKEHVPSVAKDMPWLAEVSEQETIEETCNQLRRFVGDRELVGVVVGAETGVILADELSEALGLRTNGTICKGRRNKSEQQKLVKAAGLRSTREASGTLLSEVREFLKNEPMPCIVKPTESCGSDGVKKCKSIEEAEAHFELLMRSQKKAGAQNGAVICQEFLAGQEYVVDHVSRDGVHKTVMVWVYDKRPTNGGEFVYYNMLPVESSDPVAQALIAYTQGVIDALDIKHGPTHAEVMMTHDGTPCLVEMNCRAHGWDGAWAPLERALVGYSQVETACDSYFNADALMRCQIISPHFWRADKWWSWSPTSRAVSTLCQGTRRSSNCHRLASWRLAGILQLGKTWSSQSICSHALALSSCVTQTKSKLLTMKQSSVRWR